MKKIADFDLEADDYLKGATIIWCGSILLEGSDTFYIYHVDTEEVIDYPSDSVRVSLEAFLELLQNNIPCAYNGISYDLPLLLKLHRFKYDLQNVIDPHILSRLYNPDRVGHSLRWWGEKFGSLKGDHEDFTRFSNKMLHYNLQDTKLLRQVREYLLKEGKDWDWSEAIKLEYNIWHVQQKQEQHGVLFDQDQAEKLLEKISAEIEIIESEIIKEIPPVCKDMGEVKKVFNKDGTYTLSVRNWLAFDGEVT